MPAQVAPVFGSVVNDYNGDRHLDVMLVGNSYANEILTGWYDASIGLYLAGNGKGQFRPVPVLKSGFFVDGDAKGMAQISINGDKTALLVSQNNGPLKAFLSNVSPGTKTLPLQPQDAWALITYKNGQKERKEFYYGSTYLSQSTRKLSITPDIISIVMYNTAGKARNISL
jgi:hypothetical protein